MTKLKFILYIFSFFYFSSAYAMNDFYGEFEFNRTHNITKFYGNYTDTNSGNSSGIKYFQEIWLPNIAVSFVTSFCTVIIDDLCKGKEKSRIINCNCCCCPKKNNQTDKNAFFVKIENKMEKNKNIEAIEDMIKGIEVSIHDDNQFLIKIIPNKRDEALQPEDDLNNHTFDIKNLPRPSTLPIKKETVTKRIHNSFDEKSKESKEDTKKEETIESNEKDENKKERRNNRI